VLGSGCMSEVVAASVLGWNYGEGHLCDEHLLRAVQSQCHFEDGELRAIVVESQPLLGSSLHWRIFDAARGQLAEGYATLDELKRRAPSNYGPLGWRGPTAPSGAPDTRRGWAGHGLEPLRRPSVDGRG